MLTRDLKLLVNKHISDNVFSIHIKDLLSVKTQSLFLNYFPNGNLTVNPAVLSELDEKIIISGYLSTQFFDKKDLKVVIYFSIIDHEPALSITFFELPDSWKFSNFFPDLAVQLDKNQFTATDIELSLTYKNGVSFDSIHGRVKIAHTYFHITATHSSNTWILEGITNSEQINITDFIADLQKIIGVPVPPYLPNINVQNLYMRYDSGDRSFSFNADTIDRINITIGTSKSSIHARIYLASYIDSNTSERIFTGLFNADLTVSRSIVVIEYDFSNVPEIKGYWKATNNERLDFNDFTQLIGIPDPINLPLGLDFSLAELSFVYNAKQNEFTLSARTLYYGEAFLTTIKDDNASWGFVFGADIQSAEKFSEIPIIGQYLEAADFVIVDKLAFLYSSATLKRYTIPILPPISTDRTLSAAGITLQALTPIGMGATVQLSPGLSILAEVNLGGNRDKKMSNLKSLVEEDVLLFQIAYTQSGIKLFASLENITIPVPSGSKLVIPDAKMLIDIGSEIVFQLYGRMKFSLNSKEIEANLRLILSESEAQVAFAIQSDNSSLPSIPGIKGLHLKEFGLEMGVFFEPPGLDFGIQGKFSIGEQVSDDTFGIVLEIIEEVPNILYLSFYLESLDLGEILAIFTNQAEPNIVEQLTIVKASNLSFYFAENIVVLPDGTIAQPGFRASATLQILNFGCHGNFSIDATNGVTGLATISPININHVLFIHGDGQAIKRNFVVKNGQKVPVVNNQIIKESKSSLPVYEETIVEAGGPVIAINTLGSPYFHLDWSVSLFDLIYEKVTAEISKVGIHFSLEYTLAGIERVIMSCTLKDWSNFIAEANFNFGIDKQIGPLNLMGINIGTLHLAVDFKSFISIKLNSTIFSLGIKGGFDFMGINIDLPSLIISIAPKSLFDIVEAIIDKIIERAEDIFSFILNDVKIWADLVAKNIIIGVNEAGKILKNAYQIAGYEAVAVMKFMQRTADAAAAELQKVAYAAVEIMEGLDKIYKLTAEQATDVMKHAGYAVNEVGNALSSVYNLSVNQVEAILNGANFVANEVANWTTGAAGDVAVWALDAGKDSTKWTLGAGKDSIYWTLGAGKDTLDWVAGAGKDVASLAADVGKVVGSVAGDVGKAVGSVAGDVGKAVGSAAGDVGKAFNPSKW